MLLCCMALLRWCTLLQLRAALPDAVGGVLWFGPHAALTTVFTPFVAGMHASDSTFEHGHQGKARHSCWPLLPHSRRACWPGWPTAFSLVDRRERLYRFDERCRHGYLLGWSAMPQWRKFAVANHYWPMG